MSLVSLFDEPTVRHTDPDTSHEAAELASGRADKDRMIALRALYIRPMTDYELADETGRWKPSIGKRRTDLFRAGLVDVLLDTEGNRVKRPTPTGANALVWYVTGYGEQYLQGKLAVDPSWTPVNPKDSLIAELKEKIAELESRPLTVLSWAKGNVGYSLPVLTSESSKWMAESLQSFLNEHSKPLVDPWAKEPHP